VKNMKSRIRTVAVAAVVSALTVAGLAVAQNDDGGSKDKSGKAKAGQRPPGPPPGGGFMIGGPGDRGGSLTYSETHLRKDGKDVTVRSDRGKVVSTSDDSISIERNDGETVEVAVDGDTKVLAGPRKRDADVTDIADGKQVVVIRDDADDAAEAVLVEPKNRGKLLRHRFGGPPPGGGDMPAPPSFDGDQG
jgi:hypothetical protein